MTLLDDARNEWKDNMQAEGVPSETQERVANMIHALRIGDQPSTLIPYLQAWLELEKQRAAERSKIVAKECSGIGTRRKLWVIATTPFVAAWYLWLFLCALPFWLPTTFGTWQGIALFCAWLGTILGVIAWWRIKQEETK